MREVGFAYILLADNHRHRAPAFGHHLRDISQFHLVITVLADLHTQVGENFGVESPAAAELLEVLLEPRNRAPDAIV